MKIEFNFATPGTGGEYEEDGRKFSPAIVRGSSESSAVAVRATFLKKQIFSNKHNIQSFWRDLTFEGGPPKKRESAGAARRRVRKTRKRAILSLLSTEVTSDED